LPRVKHGAYIQVSMQSVCVPADIMHYNESVNSVIITYSSY